MVRFEWVPLEMAFPNRFVFSITVNQIDFNSLVKHKFDSFFSHSRGAVRNDKT